MHVQTIQWWLLNAISSTHSLSILLSAFETSFTTQLYNTNSPSTSLLIIVRSYSHMFACVVYTSRGYYLRQCLFHQRFWLCGYYFRVALKYGMHIVEPWLSSPYLHPGHWTANNIIVSIHWISQEAELQICRGHSMSNQHKKLVTLMDLDKTWFLHNCHWDIDP